LPSAPEPTEPTAPRYRPLPPRRRWQIALLALATATTIVLLVLFQPGAHRTRPLPQPCRAGQQSDCVGGKAEVIVVPAAASTPG